MHPMVKYLEGKRKRHKMNQQDYAVSIGMKPSMYSSLKSGRRQPGKETRALVREAYPRAPQSIFLDYGIHDHTTTIEKAGGHDN